MENIQRKIWETLGGDGEVPTLNEEAILAGLFTASYRGNFSFEKKTVLILGDSKLAEVASKLAFELKSARVLLASKDTMSFALQEKDSIQIIISCSTSDLLSDYEISIASFSSLEGYLETNLKCLRTKTLMAAEKENLNTVNPLYFWVSSYAICLAKLKGEYVDPNAINVAYYKLLREETNLLLFGLPEYGIEEVATQIGAISGRVVIFLNETNIKMMDLQSLHGKILVMKEDIASLPSWEYSLFANGSSFFVSAPLKTLEGNQKAGTRESRMKHYLNAFNYYSDHTYEYREDIGLAASTIWREFLKAPYTKRI